MAETLTDASVKKLQLISGLIDVLVDLTAQGASVKSIVVTEILYSLVTEINHALAQIEVKRDVNTIKNRSRDGRNVDTEG